MIYKKQWKQPTSLKKIVIDGKSGDRGWRSGDSSKIIYKYVCVCVCVMNLTTHVQFMAGKLYI
jgi:hypothetical protein